MQYRADPSQVLFILEEHDVCTSLLQLLEHFRISRPLRYRYLQEKRITVNNVPVSQASCPLQPGDRVQIRIINPGLDRAPAERPCRIVYEDDLIYVAHKEAGILVHEENDPTCLAAQAACYQKQAGIEAPVRYVHRLDRETSGLVLFVKVPFFQAWYDGMLAEKKIQRIYLAICAGTMTPGSTQTFRDPIGHDRHRSGRYRISASGKDACTHVNCLNSRDGISLLECSLETGRTHQIRVHLSAHRLPIVNDPLYGVPDRRFPGMGLLAWKLVLSHPVSGETRTITDDLPAEFRNLLSE